MAGCSPSGGTALEKSLAKARFHAVVEWRERYASVETVGIVEVDGKPAYEVRVITKDERQGSQFYDKASGRLVKRIGTTSDHHGGESDMQIYFREYKEFDGVWLATQIHVELESPITGKGTQTWTFTEIVHNEDIPASLFEMPEGLRKTAKAKLTP